jgi:hypothetical protein
MDRDDVLDEVGNLAALEHFFIVECLSVQCALGHDLEESEGGASDQRGRDAIAVVMDYAKFTLMNRFRNLNAALVEAHPARDPELGRADSASSASHPAIPLEPPSAAELGRLVEREQALAERIDERYTTLAAELAASGDRLGALIEGGADHVDTVARLRDAIGDAPIASLIRARERTASDSLGEHLLQVSNRAYRTLVSVLRDRLALNSSVSQGTALDAMDTLNDANRVLVQRGLLPPFSPD